MTSNINSLINTQEAKNWLENAVNFETQSIDFCSAYMKIDSIDYFHKIFKQKKFNGKGRFLARWRLNDLVQGSSDIEVYDCLKNLGYDFYIKLDFHGKIYRVCPGQILMGSSNMTNSGFGLNNNSNDETGTILDVTDKSIRHIDNIFNGATKMNDLLFKKLFIEYSKVEDKSFNLDWSEAFLEKLSPTRAQSGLLVNECFLCHSPFELIDNYSNDVAHDISLLCLSSSDLTNIDKIKMKFVESRMYRWLLSNFNIDTNEIYFGKLSEILHNELVDDPRPYRKDVKQLLQNLLTWVIYLKISDFKIDQPNYSQRISKIN